MGIYWRGKVNMTTGGTILFLALGLLLTSGTIYLVFAEWVIGKGIEYLWLSATLLWITCGLTVVNPVAEDEEDNDETQSV